MATTYYPEKIFVVRYEHPYYVVDRIYTSFTSVQKEENERLIVCYDSPSWGIHQIGTNSKVAITYKTKPSGTSETNDGKDRIETISGTFDVGGQISLTTKSGTLSDVITNPSDGKVYYLFNPRAYKSDGTSIHPAAFTLSGFGFTFTASGNYPFQAESDFAGGYKNPNKPFAITLSAHYYKDLLTQYTIANAVFYMKESTASTYTSQVVIDNTVTVPAGTLQDSKAYDIYFDATDTDGTTVQCGQAQITTSDGPAVTSAVSPNNEVTYGTVSFRWNYSNITGELQYAFDLQVSPDNSTWTNIFSHEVTEATQITADVTTSGTVYWRVRGYNQSDVAGDWSASISFANVVPPQPPVILQIIPGGRIQVRWSATGQISYQLQVLQGDTVVYDSGIIYGTSTLARVNEYLTNGQYTVRVRVSNSYGLASEWGTMNYQQQSQLPNLTVAANYSEALEGVRITVQDTGYEKFYLIRNGVLAAKFTETEYIDRFAAGTTQYRLIGVNAEDNFGQAIFTVTVPAGDARLITEDGLTLSVSERWENMNVANQSEEIRASANEFFGATAPEHTFSKMRSKRITRAFYDPDRISAQLLGKIAFYTDEYGNADWVAVISRTRSDSWIGDETTIEMELTARNEVITYDN